MRTAPKLAGWKDRLYRHYVSSGQVPVAGTEAAEFFFRHRAAYIQRVIRKFIPSDRQARIIDLGCGHGAFLHFLGRVGYTNAVGVDASPEQIAQAHRLGIGNAEHRQLDAFLESVTCASVDVVLLFDVLEHLTHSEFFSTLDTVHRVLKKSGWCIVHVPNAEGVFGMRVRYGDLTHEQAFTPQSLKQAFTAVGFSSVSCYEDRPCIHGFLSGLRRLIWETGTLPLRLLLAAETGTTGAVLSQNMLGIAQK